MHGTVTAAVLRKVSLTYAVPYAVSTYSAWRSGGPPVDAGERTLGAPAVRAGPVSRGGRMRPGMTESLVEELKW